VRASLSCHGYQLARPPQLGNQRSGRLSTVNTGLVSRWSGDAVARAASADGEPVGLKNLGPPVFAGVAA
jgi:hypothetical protein